MCVVDCIADSAKEFQPFGNVQLMAVAITIERLAFDVLHHEVRQAVFSSAAVEQSCDMRMIECGEYLSFFTKAAEDEVSVHPALDQFYGGPFVELIVRARCLIDRAHAAASNLSVDSISAKAA